MQKGGGSVQERRLPRHRRRRASRNVLLLLGGVLPQRTAAAMLCEGINYMVVNGVQEPAEQVACALCCTPLGRSYVRDLQTRLVYHNLWCLESHVLQSIVTIEDAYRSKEGQ